LNESERDVADSVFCDGIEAPAESGTEHGTDVGCSLWLAAASKPVGRPAAG